MQQGGVFELRTASDLLAKLRHDVSRLRANNLDGYAAFDVFVTARHLPDWIHPNDQTKREQLFAQHVELRICRHLADQAKHFLVGQRRHKQVQDAVRKGSAWGASWGDSWGASWGIDVLAVQLDPADPDTIMFGPEVPAIDLAERVLSILENVVPCKDKKS